MLVRATAVCKSVLIVSLFASPGRSGSGARFLAIASKGFDLIPQNARTLQVATRQCHRQGKFKLLELMFSLDRSSRLQMAARRGGAGTGRPCCGSTASMGGGRWLILMTTGKCHGCLSFHSGCPDHAWRTGCISQNRTAGWGVPVSSSRHNKAPGTAITRGLHAGDNPEAASSVQAAMTAALPSIESTSSATSRAASTSSPSRCAPS